jgi:hypothetical protein
MKNIRSDKAPGKPRRQDCHIPKTSYDRCDWQRVLLVIRSTDFVTEVLANL